MTTAISLSLVVLAGTIAYVLWAAHEVAGGVNVWWFIAGAPVAALAIPALLTILWFTITWNDVSVVATHSGVTDTVLVHAVGGWVSLGVCDFDGGGIESVTVRTTGTISYVAADAVKFTPT